MSIFEAFLELMWLQMGINYLSLLRVFSEAHAINPFGFNSVSAETARILQSGAVLKVSGTARNKFAQPLSSADAAAEGFNKIGAGLLDSAHQFGVQRATTGGALNTSTSTTTTYIRQ